MRNVGRTALLLLFPLLATASLNIPPAQANDTNGSLTANQAVTGTVTNSGSDNYTFTVADNKSFVVVLSETGTHDQNFLPRLKVEGPDNSGSDIAVPYYRDFFKARPANGSWSVKVARADVENSSGGTYSLTLVQVPFSGASALSSSPQAGSNDKNKVDGWTFTGTTGHKVTLTLATSGDETFAPQLYIFKPSGELVSSPNCTGGCGIDIEPTENGAWTIAVSKVTGDGSTGLYTLSVADAN